MNLVDAEPMFQELDGRAKHDERLFKYNIFVPGMSHLMDNLLSDMLSKLAIWPHMAKHLSALEAVLKPAYTRERLQQTCFPPENIFHDMLDRFDASLSPTRIAT